MPPQTDLNLADVSQMLSHIFQIILTTDCLMHIKGSADEHICSNYKAYLLCL